MSKWLIPLSKFKMAPSTCLSSIHVNQRYIHVLFCPKMLNCQQMDCDIMYIQQTTPQITIHLLYIDTLQQVDYDIMYIQQSIPQITIHWLYIDTLQQVDCDIIYYHNPPVVRCLYTTSGL
jgi:Iap family predicted aminopeptidase